MKLKVPNTFVIVSFLILLAAAATWLYPGAQPQTLEIFTALYHGFAKQSGIIVFLLVVGAAFWTLNAGKALDRGIEDFLRYTRKLEQRPFLRRLGVKPLVIVLVMLMFSLFGAVFGMSEETLAFVMIMVPLAVKMGYDSLTGVAMVYVAAHVGFTGAFLNPFSVGIAQQLAQIPLFSGMGYRALCWLLCTAVALAATLAYAAWVRRHPERSPMYAADAFWRGRHLSDGASGAEPSPEPAPADKAAEENPARQMSARQMSANTIRLWGIYAALLGVMGVAAWRHPVVEFTLGAGTQPLPYLLPLLTALFAFLGWRAVRKDAGRFVLVLLLFTILYLVVGVLAFSWYITEISGLFLALGLLSGLSYGWGANEVASKMVEGAKDMLSPALVVGLAAGIIVVLQEGAVLDPLLNALAGSMGAWSRTGALEGMFGIQTLINCFLTSASAKAAITIPLMAPFSDMIGVSRQAMVLAFQFGDGITNMITPTSGILIAVLGAARIPYAKWARFIWPFLLALTLLAALLLAFNPW